VRTDDVLDQIDTALHDNTVSGDAMRSRPAAEPVGRGILVRRLVERHGLDHDDARTAVIAHEQGRTTEHTSLVQAEARAVIDETMHRLRAAFRPMAETMNATLKQIAESLKTLRACNVHPHTPARHYGRPAWQSPYGPARRKR